MAGLVGGFILITFVIALVIASARDRDRTWSFGRFAITLLMAWILVAAAGLLVLLGLCAVLMSGLH